MHRKKIGRTVAKLQTKAISIRKIVKDLVVAESTLRGWMNSDGRGVLQEVEEEIVQMLRIKAKWGFAASRDELKDIIKAYVKANKDANTAVGVQVRNFKRFKAIKVK